MIAADLDQGRHATEMNEDKDKGKAPPPMPPATPREGKGAKPEWANGLRQLYDSVVNEPLPDSFADLIAKLDESAK
jgi:hypothetical protein